MFLNRNKKNNVYPCIPQFYYIKVGLKGAIVILVCFRDVDKMKVLISGCIETVNPIYIGTRYNDKNRHDNLTGTISSLKR